mmetsp:Transcript_34628/g.82730  ORF Transcript_34628/g.82730 Transcript_34628/m.82730 type:complete len:576 (+) Transcript_34628:25-1752(+)
MASRRPGGRQSSVDLNKLISTFAETYWCAPSTASKSYTSPEVSLVPESRTDALKSTSPKSNTSANVSTPDTSLASSSLSSNINMNEELEECAASVRSIQSPPQIRRVSLDRNVKTINGRTDDHEANSEANRKFRCVPKRLPMMVFETYCQSRSDKVSTDEENEVPSDEENGQLSVSNAPEKDHSSLILEEYGLTRSSKKVGLLSTGKPTEIQLHTVVRHSEEGDEVSSSASVSMFDEGDLATITARQIGTYLSEKERNRIGSKILHAKTMSGYRVAETRSGSGSLCETCSMPRLMPLCKTEKTSNECPFCPALKMNVLKKILAGESPVYGYVATPQLVFDVQETNRQSKLNRVAVGSGGPPTQLLRDAEVFVLAAHQSIASIDVDESSTLCACDEVLQFDKSLAAVDNARKRLTSGLSDSLQSGNEGRDGCCPVPEVKKAVRSCRGIDLDEGKEALAQAKQALVQKIDLVSKTISPSRIATTVAKQGSSEYVSLGQARAAEDLMTLEEDFSCSVEVSMTSEEVSLSNEGCFVMVDTTAKTNSRDDLHAQIREGIPRDKEASKGMSPADTEAASQN